MVKKKDVFVVIDSNALVHRAFHAIPPLTTKAGLPVNAVYGFVAILLRVFKELKPTYVAAAFDRKEKNFRHKAFDGYKAKRVKAPDELYAQIDTVKDVLNVFNIPILEKVGFEADDIIGTLAHKVQPADNIRVMILTGDMDTLQLVNDHVHIYTLKRSISDTIIYDPQGVKNRFNGLTPEQMNDYKALRGDPSDNIPGVKGIGEKGAIDILKVHGSIENLYQKLHSGKKIAVPSERLQEKLRAEEKMARLSYRLVTIDTHVPLNFALKDAVLNDYDQQKVVELFQTLEFKSLLPRVAELGKTVGARGAQASLLPSTSESANEKQIYEYIATEHQLATLLKKLSSVRFFALDTETDRLDALFGKLLGVSMSWRAGHAYYIDAKLSGTGQWKKLVAILEDRTIHKIGHNIKYDLEVLRHHDIQLSGIVFDTMIAAYLLNPDRRGLSLDNLAMMEFGYRMQPITELIGEGKNQTTMDKVEPEKVSWYAAEDADFTHRLYQPLHHELHTKSNLGLLQHMEVPLISVLAAMEAHGVLLDVAFLKKLQTETARHIQRLEKTICNLAGVQFNIRSPQQLQEVLFQKLHISVHGLKKGKTGISTSAMELEKLRTSHKIIDHILEYREMTKLQSTYIEALPKMLGPDGRLHTHFHQTIAATGRLSSADPNLQNIPIRTPAGREIRKSFIAPKGYALVSADYSQIELRAVASLANDKKMIEFFEQGKDIHRATAAAINGIDEKDVTPEMRYAAKEVNFGVLYGMGAYGLSSRTGIPVSDARAFIEQYFALYQGVATYIEETKALATQLGYVETLFGRRRYVPDLNASNHQVRAAAERIAINAPIQGTAADIMKMAMIEIHAELPALSSKSKLLLQVHDEVVLEVPRKEVEHVGKKIAEIMEHVYKMRVPITAEVKTGDNWGDMRPLL